MDISALAALYGPWIALALVILWAVYTLAKPGVQAWLDPGRRDAREQREIDHDDKVLQAFIENTKANTELRSTMEAMLGQMTTQSRVLIDLTMDITYVMTQLNMERPSRLRRGDGSIK